MRKFLIAAVAVSGLVFSGASLQADHHEKKEEGKDKGWNGVLIDVACGGKQKSEKDAIAHPKSCAMKEGCAASGYGIVKGDTFIKFDEKGNEKAKKYLAVKENGMKVHVTGKLSDDKKTITVDEIHAQDKDKKSEGEKKEGEKKE
jgi:hypothetical protein